MGTCESLDDAAWTWKSPESQPCVSTTCLRRAVTIAPRGVTFTRRATNRSHSGPRLTYTS